MGQYYTPVALKNNWKKLNQPVMGALYSYDYENGQKLMEHSFVGNDFVNAAMRMIEFYDHGNGVPFAWVGDYADEVFGKDLFALAGEWMNYTDGNNKIIDTRKYRELKLFIRERPADFRFIRERPADFRFILNRTKRQFVEIPKENNTNILHIHPLPILTCHSNIGCSGDYNLNECINPNAPFNEREYKMKPNARLVGSWKFDRISVTDDINEVVGFKFIGWTDETLIW